jgi:hypothetical protein
MHQGQSDSDAVMTKVMCDLQDAEGFPLDSTKDEAMPLAEAADASVGMLHLNQQRSCPVALHRKSLSADELLFVVSR